VNDEPMESGVATAEAPAPTTGTAERIPIAVRGEVVRPGDPGYDTARGVYNAMIDRHPRLIVRCLDVADVIAAVAAARTNNLPLAIRGGGHNVAGLGTCDDGVVADLSPMKQIRVDPPTRTVRVAGGCTWGEVDQATHAFGLAVPSGIISTTGVGGLTLGGGFGHLTRTFGLTCDNLLSADVVTADGRFLTVSADQHPDLFWALRGGGGNFGVVTSFEFRLHPVETVLGGPIFYPIDRAADALRFYRDYMTQAPAAMSAFFGFHLAPPAPFIPEHLHNLPVCLIVGCYSGPPEEGEAVVKPLREFGPPLVDLLAPIPYPALNGLFDALYPPGLHHYWKADFVTELSDAMIDIHTKHGPTVPGVQTGMHLYPLSGAPQRVGRDETAFSFRDVAFVHNLIAVSPDPAAMPEHRAWVGDYWAALHPHAAGGTYVNFLMDEGADRVKATYRDNFQRLAAVKAAYDPTNLFRVNQNIPPQG